MVERVSYDGYKGHYRVAAQVAIVASQAANSRLFELRNTSSSMLIVPTKIKIGWLQTAAHTAAIEDSLDLFKCTGFSAVDTVNTVTPTATVKHTASMVPAASMSAAIRHVTVAGAAAGMTGGTLTKIASPISQLGKWLLLAQPTVDVPMSFMEMAAELAGEKPLMLAQNEGFIIENRVLLGLAAGSSVYFDISWAELPVLS